MSDELLRHPLQSGPVPEALSEVAVDLAAEAAAYEPRPLVADLPPMVITYLAKGYHDDKRLTSCGRPTLFARTALLVEDGKPVPQGEVGEICVSGPLLVGGYWNLPAATAETFKNGWLHTGDMAREERKR